MINWEPIENFPMEYVNTQKEVLLKTYQGIVSAWACIEHPTNDAQDDGYYDWVCYDDMFTLEFDDSTITHFAEID